MRDFDIKETYVNEDDPWLIILAVSSFAIISTTSRLKGYSPGQLLFGSDMIIPIKHNVDWEVIHQQKDTPINKDNIHENNKRADHYYKSGDKVMLTNNSVYKYKTPYNRPFVIVIAQCWTNGTVTL